MNGAGARTRCGRRVGTAVLAALGLAACSTAPPAADPASDAPEATARADQPYTQAATYEATLALWRGAADVNAWIGARFEYDLARAVQLSETQRQRNGQLPIHAPAAFFGAPKGVCVDLARFAVETLRVVDPPARPAYLMIEFEPVTLAGNTLRRHWVASFRRDGGHYFFADSKRPGHIAGPYASTQDFIDAYALYRGRRIVAYRERATHERQLRTPAVRQPREERP
ncbi:MAG: hypothetical protein HY855_14725 [Burkholderiales bacterium]|nr:hypothetical protein [Burkholderiales bacterium]